MALENEYLVKGESIKGVADAIRAKTSATDELSFPEGFKTAISGIKTEKPEQEKTVSASPDAEVVVSPDSGKALSKVTVGKIPRATGNGIVDYPDPADPHKALFKINLTSPGYLDSENVDNMGMGLYAYLEEEIIPGTTDTVLESGGYIDGNITIKGDANLTSGNIKSGSSIFGVNGTFNVPPYAQDVATAAQMNANLVAANVGHIYRFTGTTDDTYTHGDIYIVEG